MEGVTSLSSTLVFRDIGFGIVSRRIIQDEGLSVYAKMVYTVLTTYANKGRQCFPAVKAIARDASCSRGTAKKALKELRDAGIVEVKHRRSCVNEVEGRYHYSNEYRLLDVQG